MLQGKREVRQLKKVKVPDTSTSAQSNAPSNDISLTDSSLNLPQQVTIFNKAPIVDFCDPFRHSFLNSGIHRQRTYRHFVHIPP